MILITKNIVGLLPGSTYIVSTILLCAVIVFHLRCFFITKKLIIQGLLFQFVNFLKIS